MLVPFVVPCEPLMVVAALKLSFVGTVTATLPHQTAQRPEPFQRPKPTHTFWPASRRPEPPAAKAPQDNTKRDEDHTSSGHDEPGYGHGV